MSDCLTSELELRERIAELEYEIESLRAQISLREAEIAGLRADAMLNRH